MKAQLDVINEKIMVVSGKLSECSKRRKQMEANLRKAAKERAQAEADLKKCGEVRQQLAAGLAKCAKDRAAAEQGLAKCSRERALLEAELRQCAEVDRPNAEKALAKCASERQALEKELALLVAKLKVKGGGGAKPSKPTSSVRRRRRAARRRSKSLTQVESSDESADGTENAFQDDDDEDAEDVSLLSLSDADATQMESRQEAILQRLAELKEEERRFQDMFTKVFDQTETASVKLAKLQKVAENLLSKISDADMEERTYEKNLAASEKKAVEAEKELDKLESKMSIAMADMDKADEEMATAQASNAAVVELQLKTQAQLIQLVQKAERIQHLRNEKLMNAHANHGRKVKKLEALLDENEARLREQNDQECDKMRAQVITAKAKLDTAAAALANCLQAKKDIQAKIDKVEELRDIARKGLEQCLATKARLKSSLDDCHHRRDSARQKLKECLDRKKDLKAKIAACHTKRDEARKKLAQCLQNKKILSSKIAKAKAGLAKSSLLQVEDGSGTTELVDDLEEALTALHAANDNFDTLTQEDLDLGNLIEATLVEIKDSSGDHKQVQEALEAAELMEVKSQEDVMKLQTTLEDAYKALTGIDYKALEAQSELEAVGEMADQAMKILASVNPPYNPTL